MDISERLENFESVKYRIKAEGIDYTFRRYSTFEEIEDPKFHELRQAYLKASEDFIEYVNDRIEELQELEDKEDE